ncbi:MAG: GTA-gp10 family protein, partial [Pseudomonadota bacterium]
SADVLALLRAGLAGGGAAFDPVRLDHAEIEGGPMAAARAAAELIARAFVAPGA